MAYGATPTPQRPPTSSGLTIVQVVGRHSYQAPHKSDPPPRKKNGNLDINSTVLLLKSLLSVHFMNDSAGLEMPGLNSQD